MKKLILTVSVALLALLLLAGCGKKQETPTPQQKARMEAPNPHAGELVYSVPDGWVKEEPKSRMRKAQFRMPGVDGADDAVLAVFYFPGTGGTVDANLQRWYGQFKQPDGSPTGHHAEKKMVEANGMPVTLVYVTGTYLASPSGMMGGDVVEKPNYAMLAAIVETPNGPWFFKAVGPQKTIDHWRPQFEKFVQTFQFKAN